MTFRRSHAAGAGRYIVVWALLWVAHPIGTAQADVGRPGPRAGVPSPLGVARFALVIGNNQPESSATVRLRYADDDAVAIHKLLLEAGVESVLLSRLDEDTRRLQPGVAPNGLPRDAAFTTAVTTLFDGMRAVARRGGTTELLVFYSGHGDVSAGEGYVLLEDRRIMRRDLYELLSRSPATHNHVFVDACKSYFFAFEKGTAPSRTSYARSFAPMDEPGRLANVGFVLSTSSDRDSHEWERFQAGILSYELRSALRGAADVDGDGRVNYAELGAFLTRANHGIQNPRFRPDFLVRPPQKDLRREILHWDRRLATVRLLPGASAARFYVENARGERLLDAPAAPERALTIVVPQERPLFVRRHDETAEYVLRAAGPATIVSLDDAGPPTIASRGALHLAFEQLFAATFGPEDVVAFERQQAVDLSVAAPATAPREHEALRWGAAAVAGAGLVAGLTLNVLALNRYASGDGASQVQLVEDNRYIHRLNVASVLCYAVAGAAGLTWGWLTWRPGATTDLAAVGPGGSAENGGFTFTFRHAF